jgi:(E)-4-hydroxy-3-methylbut-2-enyl-diphosphate synthase
MFLHTRYEMGYMIKRKKTRQITVGKVKMGGDAPVSIQSMTNTETSDVVSTVRQIKKLEDAGCEIIRVAVKSFEDARAVKAIRKKISIPLVCDIHFNHLLALECINSGADKIRLNPGNIRKKDDVALVVNAAKKAGIPIRIGVNSGSVAWGEDPRIKSKGKSLTDDLVHAAIGYVKFFEELRFRDIVISLKASDVVSTVDAYRKMSELCDYPLHLGVTAAGPFHTGVVKSSMGIGALLLDGIGDTIRVSLTSDPVNEIKVGRKILSSAGLRHFGPEIISCPTCGRCQVDLISMVNDLESKLASCGSRRRGGSRTAPTTAKPFTIAMMGCEVNGPGEAKEADIGIAFGKNSGALFKHGKIIKKVASKDAVKELLKLIRF